MDDLIEQVKSVLITTPERWNNLVDAISIEHLSLPPAPNEWSAIECLLHLIDTEQHVFPVRVSAFMAGQDFPAASPDEVGAGNARLNPTELAANFAHLRAESLALLNQVTPGDLGRVVRHAELGMVSLS
jgi:DinB superfamily